MAEPIIVYRATGGVDASTWIGRIVTETNADVVALSDDPTTEAAFGTVHLVAEDGLSVGVCVGGMSRLRVGAGGMLAEVAYAAALDGASAAADGKGTAATAGDFYVGRPLARADAAEDDLIPVYVCPGQLAQAAG